MRSKQEDEMQMALSQGANRHVIGIFVALAVNVWNPIVDMICFYLQYIPAKASSLTMKAKLKHLITDDNKSRTSKNPTSETLRG